MRKLWPWANEAHVSLDDIHKLWELVELEFPQQGSDTGDSGIALHCDTRTIFRIGDHGSEFVNRKERSPSAHPLLAKENRTRRTDSHHQGYHHHKGKEDHEADTRTDKIEQTLSIRETPCTIVNRLICGCSGVNRSGDCMQLCCI